MYRGNKIRVGTLNIFNKFYYNTTKKVLSSSFEYANNTNRRNLLYNYLLSNLFDIICLQEVDSFMINNINVKFRDFGFAFDFPANCITPSANSNNCCIIYKKDFKLLSKKNFDLNESVQKYFAKYSSESQCEIQDAFLIELKKRQSLATMIILELASNTFIGICNCHIYWNPSYPDIKLFHTYLIIKEFYEFIENNFPDFPLIPLLLIGDFNSTPFLQSDKNLKGPSTFSGVYELITTGKLSKNHEHHPSVLRKNTELKIYPDLIVDPFKSIFNDINGKEPLFTNKTKSFSGCIDYIFYKGLVPLSAQIIPNDIENIESLPTQKYPSDHALLISDIFIV
ncbi:carbon catabolite repressor protein 4, putative [Plasmodium berghei]|uniref:CCR4 domain-containing protein 3, putative n=2 Tax=Plasmodium berghei TaxID=5821 RepID=A0A509AJJ1_PLABA|nr:CCR4 domain-containing protein 3, putative [Plasmodium berghei ANKA]CXH87172.1 carbon catabolite repressor protein 4, putative [Plasmodium berghei]SCL90070.1 carbon catabolite repressor protein 4, putative [Plasmodium berghei]SCM15211.1 carbon catabolite repressor protein 4, putative [Plasmodium berghei]SCM17006.1 carbon catabolite repressor protein 4, putative [Plasmodium berghei]SCN21853.1 carbon catabolite repressor protein 4, putative [Plasmodium berghei]|eukprot:XP_034419787.1 CCR4 domain-containing protein 3, putative [Plasmodium berghei ANKA]